jgi:flagellar hook-associated protein 1 FlgK
VSNLLSSLITSSGALQAYDQVLQVAQNNVANATTPGFVKHRQSLSALPFDPAGGLNGGVRAADVESSRSSYADQTVRRQIVLLGAAQQQVESLGSLESAFDISGNSGIPRALNDLYSAFSAWTASPSDTVARQNVLERAGDVATAFQQTAGVLEGIRQQTERGARDAVDTVNTLAGRLQTLNQLALQGSAADAGLDAQIHATLEELSEYVDFTAIEHSNGSVDVLVNGEVPLLVGAEKYPLETRLARPEDATYPDAPGSLHVTASDGTDITSRLTTGKLGALLDLRNRLLPSYLGDATQQGDLNRLAQQFADRVNAVLTAGNLSDGPPPVPGLPLFQYGADATSIASTLEAAPLQTSDLAAVSPGPPYSANGVPMALAALASPLDPADKIDGASFAQFYGSLAGRAGGELNDANARVGVQQSAVAQTKNLRDQMSGVSLDEEAAILIQFQRAYEATSRVIMILDQISEEAVNLLQR